VKNSLNLVFKDYHLGYKLEHNLNALKSLNVQAALKNEKGDFFLKADALKQIITLGCHHQHHHGEKTASHSYELGYDVKGVTEGIAGQPVTLNWAGEYDIGQGVTLKGKMNVAKQVLFTFSWIHAYNANLRFIFTDSLNMTALVSEPEKTNYDFGALLEWTI